MFELLSKANGTSPWEDDYDGWSPIKVIDTIHQILVNEQVSGSFLSIGAGNVEHDLLNLPYLRTAVASERIGINIDPNQVGRYAGFEVIEANAHNMPFEDGWFDCVLCNAMLEHDPQFWLTLLEIRRVLRPGGLVVLGVPGFLGEPLGREIPGLPGFGAYEYDLGMATLTYTEHNAPGDFYRFGPQAVRHVFLAGYEDRHVTAVMRPPRIVGWGTKPTTE